jgi:hypothetical protein
MSDKNVFINRKLVFQAKRAFARIALKVNSLKELSVVNTLAKKYLFTISGDNQGYRTRKLIKYINLVQCYYFVKVKNRSDEALSRDFHIFTGVEILNFGLWNILFWEIYHWRKFDIREMKRYTESRIYDYILLDSYVTCRAATNNCCSVSLSSYPSFIRYSSHGLYAINCRLFLSRIFLGFLYYNDNDIENFSANSCRAIANSHCSAVPLSYSFNPCLSKRLRWTLMFKSSKVINWIVCVCLVIQRYVSRLIITTCNQIYRVSFVPCSFRSIIQASNSYLTILGA